MDTLLHILAANTHFFLAEFLQPSFRRQNWNIELGSVQIPCPFYTFFMQICVEVSSIRWKFHVKIKYEAGQVVIHSDAVNKSEKKEEEENMSSVAESTPAASGGCGKPPKSSRPLLYSHHALKNIKG